MSKYNFYRDYYGLPFTKIYWSKLVGINIKKGEYRCYCCNKLPHECDNKESAVEYDKIKQVVDKSDLWSTAGYQYPVYWTGWIRYDNNPDATVISKLQRELAKAAGFTLNRSGFW